MAWKGKGEDVVSKLAANRGCNSNGAGVVGKTWIKRDFYENNGRKPLRLREKKGKEPLEEEERKGRFLS